MGFYDKSKTQHSVLDVYGRMGFSIMVNRLAAGAVQRYERTHVIVLGVDRGGLDQPRKNPETGEPTIMENAPIAVLPEAIRRSLTRRHGKSEEEAKALVEKYVHVQQLMPDDVSGSFASRECARVTSELINYGRLHKDDKQLIYRTIVVFDDEDKYLPLFLELARQPVTVYFVDDFTIGDGIFPRAGFEQSDPDKLFDSKEEFEQSGELVWLVDGLMYQGEVTGWAGLPKGAKSWLLMALMRALLNGTPLFGKWAVAKSDKVVYFVPEVGRASVYRRLKKMGLDRFLGTKLFVRTSALGIPDLTDSRVLQECAGADVFLDTLIRFLEGSENSAEDVAALAKKIFAIQAVARSVNFAAHTQKSLARAEDMGPEMFRGSGDIAAFCSNGIGVMKTDEATTTVYVKPLFNRDLSESPEPFVVQGRPWIDETGDFKLLEERAAKRVGEYRSKGGTPPDPQKTEKLEFLRTNFPSNATGKEMAKAVNDKFGSNHAERTVKGWRQEAERQGMF